MPVPKVSLCQCRSRSPSLGREPVALPRGDARAAAEAVSLAQSRGRGTDKLGAKPVTTLQGDIQLGRPLPAAQKPCLSFETRSCALSAFAAGERRP